MLATVINSVTIPIVITPVPASTCHLDITVGFQVNFTDSYIVIRSTAGIHSNKVPNIRLPKYSNIAPIYEHCVPTEFCGLLLMKSD